MSLRGVSFKCVLLFLSLSFSQDTWEKNFGIYTDAFWMPLVNAIILSDNQSSIYLNAGIEFPVAETVDINLEQSFIFPIVFTSTTISLVKYLGLNRVGYSTKFDLNYSTFGNGVDDCDDSGAAYCFDLDSKIVKFLVNARYSFQKASFYITPEIGLGVMTNQSDWYPWANLGVRISYKGFN